MVDRAQNRGRILTLILLTTLNDFGAGERIDRLRTLAHLS